ncbi:methionine--tRNA ligase [Roseivirga sp. BDSF3-8]|uniref:methionine--tRNA ligase n=1 Tax=Roseivirga sp. BDSF3-8 TaxID=3241598 RepID=UPI00353276E3
MSDQSFKRYTITAALPYANGPLHIGHLAGAYLPADIYVRYLRLQKKDVVFVCGSDEHGAAITLRAKKEGVSPREIVDRYHNQIQDTFQRFGMAFDIYHRTSSPLHHETSSQFFKTLYDKGQFEEQVSEQYYDQEYDQFLADRYIYGTCPNCGYEEAYGDQCEKCGTSLSPSDLINPKSTLSGNTPILRETRHWYLPLNKFQPWLEEWLLKGKKGKWKTNVYGQCSSWLKAGLQPRAMTRDLDWGVDVPLPDTEGKKLYVWMDAPIGYISATRQWAEENGKDWKTYWQASDTALIHFIGKDNIVFHCIIFPSILKAHGAYILPENVPANEFLNLEGKKISTSRNWAIWVHEYLDDFPGKEDILRYALCANMPETKDNDFSWKDFQMKNNSELVAILGNFVNRTLVLTQKYYDKVAPKRGQLQPIDQELIKELAEIPGRVSASLDAYRFREAQAGMMDLARAGNKYLADTEPWKMIKTDPERVKTIMNLALQVTANLAILMVPFLPHSSGKLYSMLQLDKLDWDKAGDHSLIAEGHTIGTPELLFTKVEDETIEAQLNKLMNNAETPQAQAQVTPAKEEIVFDDFMKMDIRVGTVIEAEKLKKSKKLLKLTIDTGIDKRTVLSGIAEHFTAEEVTGKQVCVLINLAPRKMMGIESQGMVLMAEDADGSLRFISPGEATANGAMVS